MKRRSLSVYLVSLLFLGACATPQGVTRVVTPAESQGARLEQQGDVSGAIEAYSRAVQADPSQFVPYLRLGYLYIKQGMYEKAIANLSQTLRLRPDVSGYWCNRADCYIAIGRYDEALSDLEKAISIENLPVYHFDRAKCLFALGRYQEALADAEKTVNIQDPGQAKTARLLRGASLAYTKQGQPAAAAFNDYAAKYHEAPEPYFLYPEGVAYFLAGDLERARSLAAQMKSTYPLFQYRYPDENHAVEMFDLDARRAGAVAAQAIAAKEKEAGHFLEAFQALDRAWGLMPTVTPEDRVQNEQIRGQILALYPQMPVKPILPEEARRFFVMAKASVRDATGPAAYQQALGNYNTLLSMTPWYPLAYYNAALLRAGTGDYKTAIRDMKTYLQLEPASEEARKLTDQIYEWEAKAP